MSTDAEQVTALTKDILEACEVRWQNCRSQGSLQTLNVGDVGQRPFDDLSSMSVGQFLLDFVENGNLQSHDVERLLMRTEGHLSKTFDTRHLKNSHPPPCPRWN